MAISYNKLWTLLNNLGLQKQELCQKANISKATLAKMARNENINTDILNRICETLGCAISDIMTITDNNNYLLLHNNNILSKPNHHPFNKIEAETLLQQFKNAKIINITKDIAQANLPDENIKNLLDASQYEEYLWTTSYNDRNLNGFSLPISIEEPKDYITVLCQYLDKYLYYLRSHIAFKYNSEVLNSVQHISNVIKKVITLNNDSTSRKIIKKELSCYLKNPFWVSSLDDSYAFRGIAPFYKLYSYMPSSYYEDMLNEELSFFRIVFNEASSRSNSLHCPYSKPDKISENRFSTASRPCLYLGTTSYVCWKEMNKPNKFKISGYKANNLGKDLKIFNLAISQPLINGLSQPTIYNIELQNSMLALFPLVIATSFRVKNFQKAEQRIEYRISQLLMEIINDLGIDGIAYLSKQGNDDFQYPHGVNIALPAYGFSEYSNDYGEIADNFELTLPYYISVTDNNLPFKQKSYINTIYSEDTFTAKVSIDDTYQFYGNTIFSKIDNFISSQDYKPYWL